MMISDFQQKPIYIKGMRLYSIVIHSFNAKTPKYLKDQASRAALSVILNFAEGYGRDSQKEKRHMYVTARASLNETIACFDILKLHVEIPGDTVIDFESLAIELQKMLSALINSQRQ
ncbi:four helix bundle protein [Candidatus Margulisiibacteriota bacterium]